MPKQRLMFHLTAIMMPVTVLLIIPYCILKGRLPVFTEASHFLMFALGASVSLAGFSLAAWCVMLFLRVGNGTLAPWAPPDNFVVTGPYLHTRNPMISGVLIMLAGGALALRSTGLLAWAVLFFLINTAYFILSEERMLERRFGQAYRDYRLHVPMWLFRVTPYKPAGNHDATGRTSP